MNQTIAQIQQLLPRLTEGDRVRVLHFAEALMDQRAGKRKSRQSRHSKGQTK